MKIISINIPPSNKCAKLLKKRNVSDDERIIRTRRVLERHDADIIFFVEQFGPVFNGVKKCLEHEYDFHFPNKFIPSKSSYSGVVAAVRKGIVVNKVGNGSTIYLENLQAKFLCLEIDNQLYAGVHYPMPKYNESFTNKINEFISDKKPRVVIGDFNPKRGYTHFYEGYQDVLPHDRITSLFNTKLDYVFIGEGESPKEVIFDTTVLEVDGDDFLSDHVLTGVIL